MGQAILQGNGGSGVKVFDLGVGQTFNVSKFKGYASFTRSNFLIEPSGSLSTGGRDNATGPGAIYGGGSASIEFNYNSVSGVATISLYNNSNGRAQAGGSWSETKRGNVHAYLVIGKVKSGV